MNASFMRTLLGLLAILASASGTISLVAQEAAAPAENRSDDTVKLEKFVVTGSYIPFAADARWPAYGCAGADFFLPGGTNVA